MRLRRHRSGKLSEAGAAEDVPIRVAPLVALLLRHEHTGVSEGRPSRHEYAGVSEGRPSRHVNTPMREGARVRAGVFRAPRRGSAAGVRSTTAEHVSS